MKKSIPFLVAGALFWGVSCSSTDTTQDNSTVSTAETTPATKTMVGENPTGPGGRTPLVTRLEDITDPTFLITAASSSMMEVQLGRLAAQRGTKSAVRQYGQKMVNDHSKAMNDLKAVAGQLNVTLPTALTLEHQAIINKVEGKKGAEFDEAYVEAMKAAHKNDIALYERMTTQAENDNVKDAATLLLPLLRAHLEMAGMIEGKVD